MRRFLKYLFRIVAAVFLLLFLVFFLLYLPPVQNYIRKTAVRYVNTNYGMVAEVGKFRLGFPLELVLEDVYAGKTATDTLCAVKSLRLDIGLGRIWKKELSVNELDLRQVKFVWLNDTTGMNLTIDAGQLRLDIPRIDLSNKRVEVGNIYLADGEVGLIAADTVAADTTVTRSFDWTFSFLKIELERVSYRMKSSGLPLLQAGLADGYITDGEVAIGRQTVDVDSLRLGGGWCDIQTARKTEMPGDSIRIPADTAGRTDWIIRAGTVNLENSAFGLTTGGEKSMEIVLSGIGVRIDSVYNRGTMVRAQLRDLQAVQQDGLRIENMRADVGLDTASVRLGDVYIRTGNSVLNLNVFSNTSLNGLLEDAPLNVVLDASIGLADIVPFYPKIPASVRNRTVKLNAAFGVTTENVQVDRLAVAMAGRFDISGKGRLTSFRKPETVSGNFALKGNLADITFLNELLKADGITVPRQMAFNAVFNAVNGKTKTMLRLCQGEGCLTLDADYNMRQTAYDVELAINRFPLARFLPKDSLGIVTAGIRLTGKGLLFGKAVSELAAEVKEFEYKRHVYKDISLNAALKKFQLKGAVKSLDPDALFELSFSSDSLEKEYKGRLRADIERVNLTNLNLLPEFLVVSLDINVEAAMGANESYRVQASFDSIRMIDQYRDNDLGRLILDLESRQDRTSLGINSGDFSLTFKGDTTLLDVVKMFGVTAGVVQKQIKAKSLNVEELQHSLPFFVLDVSGGQGNVIARYLKFRQIGFERLSIGFSSRQKQGLRFGTFIKSPSFNAVKLDSIQIGAWQRSKNLAYSLDVAGTLDEQKGPFQIYVTGNVTDNRLRTELQQKDSKGEIGFDIGFDVSMRSDTLGISTFPVTPILGYSRWIVNADNRITITRDWKINADLRLAYQDKLISLQSLDDEGNMKDRLAINIEGIDLGKFSRLLPFTPTLAGTLNTELMLYSQDSALGTDGNISIKEFYYQQQRIGTVDLVLRYLGAQGFTSHEVDFELRLDSIRRALAKGSFSTSETNKEIKMDVNIPSLPLYVVNAFMPPDVLKLGGELNGGLKLRGTFDNPLLDGSLAFKEGTAELMMIGTVFRLGTEPIEIERGKMTFGNYHLLAPNNSTLALNGEINLLPFDRMNMNLLVRGQNFEVINVKQNPLSLVYGKAYVDLDARIAGAFSDLSVSGNINILNRSDITYTLKNSSPELRDKSIDLVRFVSFQDTTLNGKDKLTNKLKSSDFNLRMFVEIGDNVGAHVNLSDDGQNNVFIQGGGNLILSMNPESGLALSGKYVLTSGTVVYNVPVVGKKEFNIQNGSYVEWTGNVANPRLSISAGEQVKAIVEESDRSRQVAFESIIRIQNTLESPEISFDLNAPSDMVIQNQLATLSPEERTRQAMNLLIYGTYSGPGAVSSGNSNVANNALYGFVENELNKYSRKIGVTLGVDSYNTTPENTRTDVTYQFSKQLFNDKVRVKIGGRISTDSNEEGNAAMEDNLVDDISIEYIFTKRRNLFLKVFRHSNYESVLEGEVTQTGIGVVWRKSYQKLKDLFVRKAKREQLARERQKKIEDRKIKNKESGK